MEGLLFCDPPGYCGAFARLVSLGGGAFAKFSLPEVSNTRAVCYQNIITQIGSSVKDRNKLRRVFRPHPGDLTAQKSLPSGNCHPRKKKNANARELTGGID